MTGCGRSGNVARNGVGPNNLGAVRRGTGRSATQTPRATGLQALAGLVGLRDSAYSIRHCESMVASSVVSNAR
jgi:hypothetical protein